MNYNELTTIEKLLIAFDNQVCEKYNDCRGCPCGVEDNYGDFLCPLPRIEYAVNMEITKTNNK